MIMSKAGQPLSAEQNAKITRYLVAKRARQLVGAARTFCKLRMVVRRTRAKKLWAFAGRVAAIHGGTVLKTLDHARQRIRKRKQLEASLLMQTYFRAMHQRKQFLTHAQSVKESSMAVLSAYTVMKERANIGQCLDAKVEMRRVREERERIERQAAASAAPTTPVPAEPVEEPTVPVVSREEQLAKARAERAEAERLEREAAEAKRVKGAEIAAAAAAAEQKRLEDEAAAQRAKDAAAAKAAVVPDVAGQPDTLSLPAVDEAIETKDNLSEQIAENQHSRQVADQRVKQKSRIRRKKSMMRKKYHAMPDLEYESDHSESDRDFDSGDDLDDDDCFEAPSLEERLRHFRSSAKTGQLFYRHAGSRRRNKPQDRVIKVSFDAQGEPSEISWGRGTRHIKFADILYVASGFWTPTFERLKERKCLSVVSADKILDLEAHDELTAQLWVRGLRKLKKHSDEFSDRSARDNYKNLLSDKEAQRTKRKKASVLPIVQLQQDLFVMSLHTVFRHLEEERIWMVGPDVRQKFTPQILYPVVLKQDIPWRQWQAWIREQVTAYCRENGLVNTYSTYNAGARMSGTSAMSQPVAKPALHSESSAVFAPEAVNDLVEDKCSLM